MVIIECEKCGYTWDSKSKLMFITCPNCSLKCKREVENESLQKI